MINLQNNRATNKNSKSVYSKCTLMICARNCANNLQLKNCSIAEALRWLFVISVQFNEPILMFCLLAIVNKFKCNSILRNKRSHSISFRMLFRPIIFHQLRCHVRDAVVSIKMKNRQIKEIIFVFLSARAL